MNVRCLLVALVLGPALVANGQSTGAEATARSALQAENARLQAQFDRNAERLRDARRELAEEASLTGSGVMLAGVARLRDLARDFEARLAVEPVALASSALDSLSAIAAGERVPDSAEVAALGKSLLATVRAQAQSAQTTTTVYGRDGTPSEIPVVRVGSFALTDGARWLLYDPATRALFDSGRRASTKEADVVTAFVTAANAGRGGVTAMLLDPTRGALGRSGAGALKLADLLRQGGAVGAVILVLGAIGLLLVIWRGLALMRSGAGIRRQVAAGEWAQDNPLGRILACAGDNAGAEDAELERMLDEAIMRETPELERGQAAVKVIAAVAPLLGLLGTVVGMIRTFNTITVAGTGNPALMAGGISQALVTTMLGLLVAIPLVLLHSLLVSMSRGQIEIIEEQSAGLLARRLRERRG